MPFSVKLVNLKIIDRHSFLQEGTGAIIHQVGSDGIGKSRLLQEINKNTAQKMFFEFARSQSKIRWKCFFYSLDILPKKLLTQNLPAR